MLSFALFAVLVMQGFMDAERLRIIRNAPQVTGALNPVTASGDFVLFGRYRHRWESEDGPIESSPTEILWKVVSLDSEAAPTKAFLLSHYILEGMAYQSSPRIDGKEQNTWEGSEIQRWLNNSEELRVKKKAGEVILKGFLHEDYFTAKEKSIMLLYGDGTEGKVTLPSGEADTSTSFWKSYLWPYKGELGVWFGGYEYSSARVANFKGVANIAEGVTYGTRSPYVDAKYPYRIWMAKKDGTLFFYNVMYTGLGVRPLCVLDLTSVIFKAPLSLVASSASPDLPGTKENPYV